MPWVGRTPHFRNRDFLVGPEHVKLRTTPERNRLVTASALVARALSICATLIMFAGCATSTQSGGIDLTPSSHELSANMKDSTDPNRLLMLQAQGELPGPIPRHLLQLQLQHSAQRHGPRQQFHRDAGEVRMWGSNFLDSYLYGLNKKGDEVTTIDIARNQCYSPVTVKVDHKQNAWVACETLYPHYPALFGGEQEYGSDGTLEQSYAFDASRFCGSGYEFCAAESFDGGADNEGHVFAELSAGDTVIGHVAQYMNPGFYWWNAKDPTAGTFIRASRYCKPFCAIDYMDTDRAGNIWFDFTIAQGSAGGSGLGEVTNPTTSPTVKIVLPAGTYGSPGGVYVSNHASVLNVTDQDSRETYQYHLPVRKTSKPFKVLGPTPIGSGSEGRPTTGGFNKADSALALGDFHGWVDVGKLPANAWSMRAKADCKGPCLGVAYTPSDK